METQQELTEQYCEECQNKLKEIARLEEAIDEATAAAWDTARSEYEPKLKALQDKIDSKSQTVTELTKEMRESLSVAPLYHKHNALIDILRQELEEEMETSKKLQEDVHVLRMERDNEESENQALKIRTQEAEERSKQCLVDTETECVRRLNQVDALNGIITDLQVMNVQKLKDQHKLGFRIHMLREICRQWRYRAYTNTVVETSERRLAKMKTELQKLVSDIEAIALMHDNLEPNGGYADILKAIEEKGWNEQ